MLELTRDTDLLKSLSLAAMTLLGTVSPTGGIITSLISGLVVLRQLAGSDGETSASTVVSTVHATPTGDLPMVQPLGVMLRVQLLRRKKAQ
jgi:hypothetical protein